MTTTIAPTAKPGITAVTADRAFDFLRTNPRSGKPRHEGLSEIRGPYYSVMGPRCLADVLETMGDWVDSLKFAGGSFTLMPRRSVRELIELCHRGFDIVEISDGFITLPADDWLRLVERSGRRGSRPSRRSVSSPAPEARRGRRNSSSRALVTP